MRNAKSKVLACLVIVVMLVSAATIAIFADASTETPEKGYMLYIYNADGTLGMDINGTKSVEETYSIKSAMEDARVFVDNAFLFGITTPVTYVLDMYEDSYEDESFEISADVTINTNGHSIVCADGVEITNNGKINTGMPNAEVINLGATTVDIDSYYIYDLIGGAGLSTGTDPFDLQIAMQFLAKDTSEEAAENYYGEYITDFFITMNGVENGAAEGCYLAGYYPSYGAWVVIPLDGLLIEDGMTYPVITSAGFNFTYVDICGSVKDFTCGIFLSEAFVEANPDLEVVLSLGLSETSEDALAADYVTVGEYVYNVQNIQDGNLFFDYADDFSNNESLVVEDNKINSEENAEAVSAAKQELAEALENAGITVTEDELEAVTPVIEVALSKVESGKIVFDVAPTVAVGEHSVKISEFAEPITFRLPVPKTETKTLAKVYHEGELIGTYNIVTEESGDKYVEVSAKNFSEYAVEPVSVPTGTLTNCYTSGTGYWGECGGNASESFEFKFYNDSTYMGCTSLNNVGGIIDGEVYVSWSILLDAEANTDPYWTMFWDVAPTLSMQPNRCEQWVDGVKVAECAVEPNWSDGIFPAVAAVADADGKILSYVNNTDGYKLADAVEATNDGDTIALLADITLDATLEIPAEKNITLDLAGYVINGAWNGTSTTNHIYAINNYGTLTVTDTSAEQNGAINSRGVYNYGTLTLNAGTINAIDGNGGYAVNNESGSTFVMNGGTLATTYEDDYQSDKGGYDATPLDVPADCTATLNGGIITNVCDFTFAISSAGTLIIPADSTILVEGAHGAISVNGGTTTVNAGTFKVIKDEYVRTDNVVYVSGGQLIINGGTFVGDSDIAAGGCCVADLAGAATINGGSFSGSSGGDVWGTTGTTITGGSFENLVEKDHIQDGFELDENGNVVEKKLVFIGDQGYATLEEAIAAAVAGDEIKLLADLTGDFIVPAGVTFNGNGFAVSGVLTAAGEITFAGYTKVTNFGVQYTNTTVNIGAGATLELTGTGRMVIGHGCTFNITGTITDAKSANVAELTPSLIAAGASFTGAGVNFNVTNAYLKFTAYSSSKNSNASGTYNFNITNSIWDQTNKLMFTEPSSGMDPTFNLYLTDSVLTTTGHLVFAVTKGEIVIDNSNVNVGTSNQIENRSTMTIKNGSVVNGAVASSQNAINSGTVIVEDATYAVTGEFTGAAVGNGNLIIKNGATVSVGNITKANIEIDATNMTAGEVNFAGDLTALTGTLTVTGNDKLLARIVDGKIVLLNKVAMIGDLGFETVAKAVEYAKTAGITDLVITLVGETTKESAVALEDALDLYTEAVFNSVTIKQADNSVPYYIAGLYTGKRTNGGNFIFDGVNIVVTDQYIFEGNVKLTNNSIVKSVAEANCFLYYSVTTVEAGSKLLGVIDDLRGGTLIIDGGRTDGKYNTTPDMQDAILVIRWNGDSLTVKNGAYVNVNAANEIGRVTVSAGASLNVYDSKFDSWQWIDNAGTINLNTESVINTGKITGAGVITIDATNFTSGFAQVINAVMSEFTGTINLIGNDNDYFYLVVDENGVAVVEKKVAQIGDKTYATLQLAIDAVADGETIILLDNVTVTEAAYGQNALNYNRAVNCTIDLNGYTLSADTGNSVFRFNIADSGATSDVTVTIKNGTVISGANTWCALMSAGISADVRAILNLEDLIVENSKAYDFAIKAWENGVVNADNVTINATAQAGGFYAVGGEIVLDNCIVNQFGLYTAPYTSMAFAVASNGKMTINSGSYTTTPTAAEEGNGQGSTHGSWVGGVMNSGGTLIINGGTFANGNYGDDSLATAARGLIVADAGAVLEINGGIFNALKGIIDYVNNIGDATLNPVVTIKGGTYSANPEDNSWIKVADGYAVATDGNGTYVVVPAVEYEFLGGSLRYLDTVPGYTNMRFGYKFADDFNFDGFTWGWYITINGKTGNQVGVNYTADNRTNLVITNIPAALYTTDIAVQLYYVVDVDGVAFTVIGDTETRNVIEVASAIAADPTENATAREYAQKLVDVYAPNNEQAYIKDDESEEVVA